ncbi:MAG TPA: metalloregulator ArsR/SmtB family transcription factor [Woeseiaceae bacterium]|nr:metalloregulator ArsR/SmtB family transcription factor [Woeseiaceae bacterium]
MMKPATTTLIPQLKALADPVRLRLVALCRQGECSVSELTEVLRQSQPRISQHLKQLVDAGLLERFRDGKRVYYRLPATRRGTVARLLDLVPEGEPLVAADAAQLRRLRGLETPEPAENAEPDAIDRAVHRALLDLTITAPLGDLLDIGCGRGRMLKLLASRAQRAVGVDIDADARQFARRELLLAGLPNCSLRQGDMYRLPFADGEFDTILLDGVLAGAGHPVEALTEAKRLLSRGGRLVVVEELRGRPAAEVQRALAEWSAEAGLRLGRPRLLPATRPDWTLSVATVAERQSAAA